MIAFRIVLLQIVAWSCLVASADAFVSHQTFYSATASTTTTTCTRRPAQADPSNFLFDDFRMFNGEVVDPYEVLKIHRSAERAQIRKAYIDMSRKYHPDVVRHKNILPGSW
jgi:DnaJ-domain-containing protein 1